MHERVFVQQRFCSRCSQWLPEDAFNHYRDGRQWWCRECFRAYFRARGARHRQQVEASKSARKAAARDLVLEHLRHHSCVSCGEADPVVLDFDHTGLKSAAVAQLIADGATLERIRAEMSLCEVVCANCHRHRTYARNAGGYRGAPPSPGVARKATRARNLAFVYELLEASECVDCGLEDMTVLEFDHIGVKRAAVLSLAWDGYSLRTIEQEIDQCQIRCANCHRRRHAEAAGNYRHLALGAAEPHLSSEAGL